MRFTWPVLGHISSHMKKVIARFEKLESEWNAEFVKKLEKKLKEAEETNMKGKGKGDWRMK